MEGKKELRSKKLLTDAFFVLLNESPGETITVKELCDKANYARPTFYAHFNQIQDVPYYYYKEQWFNDHIELFDSLKQQNLPLDEILNKLIHSTFEYWIDQVVEYKKLKSIDMDNVLLKLFEEATLNLYKDFHPTPEEFIKSISGKCIIKGHAQLSFSIFDIWAYSGSALDAIEMSSIMIKVIDGTSGLIQH